MPVSLPETGRLIGLQQETRDQRPLASEPEEALALARGAGSGRALPVPTGVRVVLQSGSVLPLVQEQRQAEDWAEGFDVATGSVGGIVHGTQTHTCELCSSGAAAYQLAVAKLLLLEQLGGSPPEDAALEQAYQQIGWLK